MLLQKRYERDEVRKRICQEQIRRWMYGHTGRVLSDTPQWDVGFLRADNLLQDFAIPPGDAVSLSLRRRPCCTSDAALPISDVCVRWEEGRQEGTFAVGTERAMPFLSPLFPHF